MKKKFILVSLIVLVLVVSLFILTGCNKENKNMESDSNNNQINTETSAKNTENTLKKDNDTTGKIGEYVHYDINLDIGNKESVDDDWIVFYEDKEKGISYLIAADYVPTTNTAFEKAINSFGFSIKGKYGVCCREYDKLKKSVDAETASRFMFSYNGPMSFHKHWFAASFLDSEAWDGFVLKSKDGTSAFDSSIQAIGGPTIELWTASWKQKGYSPINYKINIDTENYSKSGYYSENSDNAIEYRIVNTISLEESGYKYDDDGNLVIDKVFFTKSHEDDKNCVNYWIASQPMSKGTNDLICVSNNGSIQAGSLDNNNIAVRPVVSLSTKLIGNNNTSEIYYTGININD